MELALTGELASLDRIDPNLRKHLVNKGRDHAFVAASVSPADGGLLTGEFRVDGMGLKGNAVLDRSLARHFSERCYLAQSTLGRLLEIYQPKDVAAAASPLTRFVKELLGLDALDALISGLHDAGDVRRLRGGANTYWEVRDRLPIIQQEVDRLAGEVSKARVVQDCGRSFQVPLAGPGGEAGPRLARLPDSNDLRSRTEALGAT